MGVVSGSRPGGAASRTLAQAACRSVAAAPLVIRRLLVLAASSPPFRLRLHVLLLDASSSSPAPPPPLPPTRVAVLRSRSSGCSGQLAVVSSQWSARNGQLKCSACIHRLTVLSTVSSHSSARLHGLAVVGSQSSACTGCITVLGLQLSARMSACVGTTMLLRCLFTCVVCSYQHRNMCVSHGCRLASGSQCRVRESCPVLHRDRRSCSSAVS